MSVFWSAVAAFFAPSDLSGIHGMKQEHICATPSWQKSGPWYDCAYVVQDQTKAGFAGMSVIRIHLLFLFHYNDQHIRENLICQFELAWLQLVNLLQLNVIWSSSEPGYIELHLTDSDVHRLEILVCNLSSGYHNLNPNYRLVSPVCVELILILIQTIQLRPYLLQKWGLDILAAMNRAFELHGLPVSAYHSRNAINTNMMVLSLGTKGKNRQVHFELRLMWRGTRTCKLNLATQTNNASFLFPHHVCLPPSNRSASFQLFFSNSNCCTWEPGQSSIQLS